MSAREVIDGPLSLPEGALQTYWKISRIRLKCWFAALRTIPGRREWPSQLSTCETVRLGALSREILVAELLTRVWSTVLVARDMVRGENRTSSIARNVYLGQLEARRDVLTLLAGEDRLPQAQIVPLDQLRRRIERWTDLLLGPLLRDYRVSEFLFDETRARELAESWPGELQVGANVPTVQLTLMGLRQAIPQGMPADNPRASLDLAVARAVLASLPCGGGTPPPPKGPDAPPPGERRGLSFEAMRRRLRRENE